MSSGVAEMERKIEQTILKWDMFPQGCRIVVGLSGGADSMALTHFLSRYAARNGNSLVAAHVNHCLRGQESDSDERFVRSFCERNGLALEVRRADVASLAKQRSLGIEECGRAVRYSFFDSLCGENGRIATAHTLSDSAETVLMNLARGAGPRGLCGIPPVRGRIVRPLLEVTRSETERYCEFYGLAYVTDSTNLQEEYARNRIRLRAVPALKSVNPSFEACVLHTTALLRCDEEYFSRLAEKAAAEAKVPSGGYDLAALQKLPRAVLLRVIPLAIRSVSGARLGYGHILSVEEIVRNGRGAVTVAGGIQCFASGNTLFVTRRKKGRACQWSVPLGPHATLLPDGREFCLCRVTGEDWKNRRKKINNLLFNNLINYDTISDNGSFIRNRRGGDLFRPACRGVTKSLKKLFNEAHTPVSERGQLAILESGGKILWVEGFGVSEEARVTENTREAAEIMIKGEQQPCTQ